MSKKVSHGIIEVKSKFDAEFRRFSVSRSIGDKFLDFYQLIERLHDLKDIPFVILYTDEDDDLLPINNNDNFRKALTSAISLLRIHIQRKDENWSELIGYSTVNRKREKGHNRILSQLPLTNQITNKNKAKNAPIKIGMPEDFRQVSAIIDVDILPQTHRRVRLLKHGSDKPLGFYIKDGVTIKASPGRVEKVPAIFISRLVPGGLAESTGILAVNDEVVEVNGIDVSNKTLDQVTDMMIANSSNLIITVKPANQQYLNNHSPAVGQPTISPSSSSHSYARLPHSPLALVKNQQQRLSQMSASVASTSSNPSEFNEDDDDLDEVRDLTLGLPSGLGMVGNMSGSSGTGSDRPLSVADRLDGRDSYHTRKHGHHVTQIVLDGKSGGTVHAPQVFTL